MVNKNSIIFFRHIAKNTPKALCKIHKKNSDIGNCTKKIKTSNWTFMLLCGLVVENVCGCL